MRTAFWMCVLAIGAVWGGSLPTSAQQAAGGGVYTAAQAQAGRTAYQARCASCHTADLGGRNDAPQLAGDEFMSSWRSRSTKELLDFISSTMPPDGDPLSPDEYLGVVSYILQQNGAAAGSQPLAAQTAVGIGTVATGRRPPTPVQAAGR